MTEWQEALNNDVRNWLNIIVDSEAKWAHNDPEQSDCDRCNATSHLRTLFLKSTITLPVRAGRIARGQWQSIALVELDGPRIRQVLVSLMGLQRS